MQASRKNERIILSTCLAAGVLAFAAIHCNYHADMAMLLFWSVKLFSLLYLFLRGSFRKTPYLGWGMLGAISLLIGILLSVMNVVFYKPFIQIGILIFLLAYGVHFIKKKYHKLPDYLKMGWVLFAAMPYSLPQQLARPWLFILPDVLWGALLILYITSGDQMLHDRKWDLLDGKEIRED